MRKIGLLIALLRCVPGGSVCTQGQGSDSPEHKTARKMCRIKLISEVEPEMTSIDSILKSIIKPGMNDEQKCIAVMRFVNMHTFWAPSDCGIDHGVRDPIVALNCYAPTICQQDAAVLCAGLWAMLGYDVRFWQLKGHTTSEVHYGGKWRNLDATFDRFYRKSDGSLASVEERNRMYKPGISFVTPWDEFEIGHRLDINLRKGESFTRYWSPVSKDKDYWRPASHGGIPGDKGTRRRSLSHKVAKKPYRMKSLGCGYSNGIWVFEPDFSDPCWNDLVHYQENIVAPKSKGRFLKPAPGKAGVLILRVFTPYIITGGWLEAELTRKENDSITVSLSDNNGKTWKEALKGEKTGTEEMQLSLRSFVGGKFSYLARIQMKGDSVGIRNIRCRTIVQVNPLSLPALKLGENIIRFDLGEQTERLTFYPKVITPEYRNEILKEENISTAREQPQPKWLRGLCVKKPLKEAYIITKMTAPGRIMHINWGGWLSKKGTRLFYSFDGKNWEEKKPSYKYTFLNSDTPNHNIAYYENIPSIPEKLRTIYFKYSFWKDKPKYDPSHLFVAYSLRADVDFVPKGLGKFPGAKTTYCWVEETDGKQEEKLHAEVIRSVPQEFKINVGGKKKPLMKWVRMEFGE